MQEETRTIDFWPGHPVSYTTTRLTMYFDEQFLGLATGFILKFANTYGLITNLHVCSGLSPIDESCLSRMGGIPNRMTFHVALVQRTEQGERYTETLFFKPMDIRLQDESGPVWHDSKTNKNQNDYCIILLEPFLPELKQPNFSLRAIEGGNVTLRKGVEPNASMRKEDIKHFYPPIGHQVFVVGYPAGIAPTGIFPIWKGGSIASEPHATMELNRQDTTEVFLIDGLTRHGMSGSPVICLRREGDMYFTDDGVAVRSGKGSEALLLGVYAGREGVTSNEADLALGRVWKIGALEHLFGEVIAKDLRRREGA